MKKTTDKKRLSVSTESLRLLNADKTADVVGGTIANSMRSKAWSYCATCYTGATTSM